MPTENHQPYSVRCFLPNPGGVYDPAPLHEFDQQSEDGGEIPQIGDILRWDETGEPYRVVARYFDYSAKQCALELTAYSGNWIGY